jgi:hypothetical protein
MRTVDARQVASYLDKAEEFLAAAVDAVLGGHAVAATSLAIHAGINAGDVVTGARTGSRAAGQDHDQVLHLLNQAGDEGKIVAKELGRLLPLKTKVEYSAETVSTATAERAVERARRCVSAARLAAPRQSPRA